MDTKLLRQLEGELEQGEAGPQIVPGRNTATSRLVPRSQIILRVDDPASARAFGKGAKAQVDQDISDRTNYIANLDGQITQKKKDGADSKELEALKASEEAKLAAVKGGKDDLVTKATGVANSANEMLGSIAGAGKAVAGVSGGKVDSAMFKSMSDFGDSVQKLTDIIDGLHQAGETDSALEAFQAHPTSTAPRRGARASARCSASSSRWSAGYRPAGAP